MIRPLEYCETPAHVQTSLDTIASRIEELFNLRELYLAKHSKLTNHQPFSKVESGSSDKGLVDNMHTNTTDY